jgi:hypothetical protein
VLKKFMIDLQERSSSLIRATRSPNVFAELAIYDLRKPFFVLHRRLRLIELLGIDQGKTATMAMAIMATAITLAAMMTMATVVTVMMTTTTTATMITGPLVLRTTTTTTTCAMGPTKRKKRTLRVLRS